MAEIINVAGKRIDLSEYASIDGGGEGSIYKISSDQCLKIFDKLDEEKIKMISEAIKCSANLYKPIEKIATIPRALVTDANGKIIGYQMEWLEGWISLAEIMSDKGTEDLDCTFKEIVWIFSILYQCLYRIHSQGFLIRDFNSSNIMFYFSGDNCFVKIIDTDSWSLNRPDLGLKFESLVVDYNEACHPEILRAKFEGKTMPPAKKDHDWWSYAFLLWRALAKQDPFGEGNIDGMTREERIMNCCTIRFPDISLYPEMAAKSLCFGPKLRLILDRFLRLKIKGVFPLQLIAELYRDSRKCQCGFEGSVQMVFCPRCGRQL